MKRINLFLKLATLSFLMMTLSACNPTVKIEAPEKPITINLNVKVQQEVRVRVEREVDQLFDEQDLF